MPPILCLDFDGVMHSYTSGWQGVDVCDDPPVEGLLDFLLVAMENFDVQVYSSRSSEVSGRIAMEDWCVKWLPHQIAWKLKFPKDKPPAFITLDDRAITFEGVWPDISTLLNFKPWNKR